MVPPQLAESQEACAPRETLEAESDHPDVLLPEEELPSPSEDTDKRLSCGNLSDQSRTDEAKCMDGNFTAHFHDAFNCVAYCVLCSHFCFPYQFVLSCSWFLVSFNADRHSDVCKFMNVRLVSMRFVVFQ